MFDGGKDLLQYYKDRHKINAKNELDQVVAFERYLSGFQNSRNPMVKKAMTVDN